MEIKKQVLPHLFIEKDIDTGNIIYQESIDISPQDSAGDLHDNLMRLGSALICKTIDAIEANNAPISHNKMIQYLMLLKFLKQIVK